MGIANEHEESPLDESAEEKQLLAAIVNGAIDDILYLNPDIGRKLFSDKERAREALRWMFDEPEETPPEENRFTFLEICSHLKVSPNKIRRHVRNQCRRMGLHLWKLGKG